jgi:hypothetical protein
VKTLVQDELQRENVTFFTARSRAVSRRTVPGPLWTGRIGNASLARNTNCPTDGTIWCRTIDRKKARTISTGLGQFPTWAEENCEEATATDGWELRAGTVAITDTLT